MLTVASPSTFYLLPEDGARAHADFLALLRSPGETWIMAYGFSDLRLYDEIESADRRGVAVHMLLDRTQAAGHAESARLKAMHARLVHSDVTLTTAGCGSASPSQIFHDKVMIVRATDGGADHVWTGSVNFSESGWLQGNVAQVLRDPSLADALRAQFDVHRVWARLHCPQIDGGASSSSPSGEIVP